MLTWGIPTQMGSRIIGRSATLFSSGVYVSGAGQGSVHNIGYIANAPFPNPTAQRQACVPPDTTHRFIRFPIVRPWQQPNPSPTAPAKPELKPAAWSASKPGAAPPPRGPETKAKVPLAVAPPPPKPVSTLKQRWDALKQPAAAPAAAPAADKAALRSPAASLEALAFSPHSVAPFGPTGVPFALQNAGRGDVPDERGSFPQHIEVLPGEFP